MASPLSANKWCYVEVLIPAEYKIVEKKILIPNEGKKVKEQVLSKEERVEIITILCEEDLSKSRLNRIKKALQKKGYLLSLEKIPIKDKILIALKKFQKENDIHIGYYSLESLNKLGVNLNLLRIKNGDIRCYQKNLIQDQYKSVTEKVYASGEERRITKQVLVKRGGHTINEICLCEKYLTKRRIRKIKRKLRRRGYQIEKVNGKNDYELKQSLVKFQRDNNLPIGAPINLKSLDALGVKY